MRNPVMASVLGLSLTFGASPGMAKDTTQGEREYRQSCASCHGVSAKGNGPLTEFMNVAVPDLTQLARNNGGVFPFERVYTIIDGRASVKGHGSREMPVWGNRFEAQASTPLASEFLDDRAVRAIARGRILAVIDYLYDQQAK